MRERSTHKFKGGNAGSYVEPSSLPLDIFHHRVLSRELIMVGKVVDDLKIVHPKMLALF
jgi:hypothetical protein